MGNLNSDCPLCDKESFSFYITYCKSHPDTPLVVSTKHEPKFSQSEKDIINRMFSEHFNVRFEMRSILDHSHAHLEKLNE